MQFQTQLTWPLRLCLELGHCDVSLVSSRRPWYDLTDNDDNATTQP